MVCQNKIFWCLCNTFYTLRSFQLNYSQCFFLYKHNKVNYTHQRGKKPTLMEIHTFHVVYVFLLSIFHFQSYDSVSKLEQLLWLLLKLLFFNVTLVSPSATKTHVIYIYDDNQILNKNFNFLHFYWLTTIYFWNRLLHAS